MAGYLMIEEINEVERIVKKSNYLVRSYYDLSLTEQRIILVAISYIADPECRVVDIPLPSYKKLLHVNDINYKHLDTVLKTLRQNTIVMAKTDKNTGEVYEGLITGWVDRIELKNNYVSITFNKDIWEHLINLKKEYTQFQLSNVLKLQSKHSMRLFEILKSYAWTGEYIAKVSELRSLLFLESKYKLYADFSKKIIAPAIEEINSLEGSDIQVTFMPIKNGNRYDHIKFIITRSGSDEDESFLPPEVQMARNMNENELFTSIKTMLTMKYRCMFSNSDTDWNSCSLYTKNALESTYLSLMSDEWQSHKITNHKAFFAEHLKRLSN